MQAVKYYSGTSQELQPTVIIYSIVVSFLASCFLLLLHVSGQRWMVKRYAKLRLVMHDVYAFVDCCKVL